MTEKERLNKITQAIIGGAIQVRRVLGPGLLESAYEACLAFELKKRGLSISVTSVVKAFVLKLASPDRLSRLVAGQKLRRLRGILNAPIYSRPCQYTNNLVLGV